MSRSVVRILVLPSCKILATFLVADALTCVFVALLANTVYALRVFLDLSMLEGAVMMIVGPTLLFRAQNLMESTGSKILLAGFLLFLSSLVFALVTML
jgi:hypothetical protein